MSLLTETLDTLTQSNDYAVYSSPQIAALVASRRYSTHKATPAGKALTQAHKLARNLKYGK